MLIPMRIFPLSTNRSVTFYDIIMFNKQIFEHFPNCKNNTALDWPCQKRSYATAINLLRSLERSKIRFCP